MIRKEGNKYILFSKDGQKRLGSFDSEKAVEKREKEINRIKHAKAALVDVELIITKASIHDGIMRWQAVASDTTRDRTGERTSRALFGDWIERATSGQSVTWLGSPRMPFLGIAHYPGLAGYGEAGPTEKMYIDGDRFKANGIFLADHEQPLGVALFEAIRNERELIQRGDTVEQPIRISAAWWDIAHSHGQFNFERKAIDDVCPMCANGQGDKEYLRGQLDHFAATRLPINPRTSLLLEEKSMATKKEDAASIVGEELADELEQRTKKVVGKSEAEQPEGLVIKADGPDIEKGTKIGDFIRKRMDELKLTVPDIEPQMPIAGSTIQAIISGEIPTPSEPVLGGLAKVLKVSKQQLKGMLSSGAEPLKEVAKNKAEFFDIEGVPSLPLGGATSMVEAQAFMDAQEQRLEVVSQWGLFIQVMQNILESSDPAEIKGQVFNLISEFGDSVAAIKAAVEDAYLVEETGGQIMTTENIGLESTHPADTMKAAIDGAMANDQLDRIGKLAAIQESFNSYAEAVKAQVDAVTPPDIGEQVAAGVEKAMGPIAEQLGLLVAKFNGPPVAAQQPQQKSFIPTGPVQKSASAAGNPQSIRDVARRSVGIIE